MEIPTYLAMTCQEFQTAWVLPRLPAWMACHFSQDSPCLTDLPGGHQAPALLILDDSLPWQNQEPEPVLRQLEGCLKGTDGLLLDFQQKGCDGAARLASALCSSLSCPVAVSEAYAGELDCPVFVSMVPPHVPLAEALLPWPDREIWLEIGPGTEAFTVTGSGAELVPMAREPELPFAHFGLHCHFRQDISPDRVCFTLSRTEEDLQSLLEEGAALGVTRAVGLWQELGPR